MEANEKKKYQNDYNRTSYVEGNTVRRLERLPDIRREDQEYENPSRSPRKRRRQKELSSINFPTLIALVVAISVTVVVCYQYLSLQAEVGNLNREVKTKQTELTKLQQDNDAAQNELNKAVDLDKIYKIAVEEYGMVYGNKNSIISFDSNNDGYVRQYEDIPQ